MFALIILQIVLIALNAIFACAEIAVLSISEVKLERMAQQGDKRARRLFALTREPARFLATIQVAITLSGFLGSAFAADNFSEPLVDWVISLGLNLPRATLDTVAVVLITLILSYFTLVFGELVPKRVAMKRPEAIGLSISALVCGISRIFKPLVWLLSVSTDAVLRLLGIDPNEADEAVSEEEIRMMVDAGSEKGAIDRQERAFIENVFEFDDLTARDIATHRVDAVMLSLDESMEDWAAIIHDSRHTLYPVCDGSPDDVVGILNAKDYFRLDSKSREEVMGLVRPPFFVPETIRADVLFKKLKKNRSPMAVVLDEHGGMVGIVTMNDLIEELVGDLGEESEELEAAEPHIRKLDDNSWAVYGNVELWELEEALDIRFNQDEVDTFTGLVFSRLDMIPADGRQSIALELDGLAIEVLEVLEHQVSYAKVCRTAPSDKDGRDAEN